MKSSQSNNWRSATAAVVVGLALPFAALAQSGGKTSEPGGAKSGSAGAGTVSPKDAGASNPGTGAAGSGQPSGPGTGTAGTPPVAGGTADPAAPQSPGAVPTPSATGPTGPGGATDPAGAAGLEQRFRKLDRNSDGMLSLDEFRGGFSSTYGGTGPAMPGSSPSPNPAANAAGSPGTAPAQPGQSK